MQSSDVLRLDSASPPCWEAPQTLGRDAVGPKVLWTTEVRVSPRSVPGTNLRGA